MVRQCELREASLRDEVRSLNEQMRALLAAKSELESQAAESSRPVLRQVEALSQQVRETAEAARAAEKRFREEIEGLQRDVDAARDAERRAGARAAAAESALEAARESAASSHRSLVEAQHKGEAARRRISALEVEKAALDRALGDLKTRQEVDRMRFEAQLRDAQERLWEAERGPKAARATAAAAAAAMGPAAQPSDVPRDAARAPDAAGLANGSAPSEASAGPPSTAPPEDALEALLSAYRARTSGTDGGPDGSVSGRGAALSPPSERGKENVGTGGGGGPSGKGDHLTHRLGELERSRRYLADRLVDALSRLDQCALLAADNQSAYDAYAGLESRMALLLETLGERNLKVDELEDQCKEMRRVFHEQYEKVVQLLNERGSTGGSNMSSDLALG